MVLERVFTVFALPSIWDKRAFTTLVLSGKVFKLDFLQDGNFVDAAGAGGEDVFASARHPGQILAGFLVILRYTSPVVSVQPEPTLPNQHMD